MNNSHTWTKVIAVMLILSAVVVLASFTDDTSVVGFIQGGWDNNVTGRSYTLAVQEKETVTTESDNDDDYELATIAYSDEAAFELYKNAVNSVKTSDVTATRTERVVKALKGSIPSMYQAMGIKEEKDTDDVSFTGSELTENFPVAGAGYACDLSFDDVKSASVSKTGSKTVIIIRVKDDTDGSYDRSSKCVSTVKLNVGSWTCKGVILKATLDISGRLTALQTKTPVYVTSGANSFKFKIEESWTVKW